MKILRKEKQFCASCMDEHDVWIIEEITKTQFKGVDVEFVGTYEYCENADEMWATEDMLNQNGKLLTESYKDKVSLLTSKEILEIRNMYGISQKDLCLILGWSSNTIGRYESGKIQDEIHNDILLVVRDNPTFLLNKLKSKKDKFLRSNKGKAYTKYYDKTANLVKESAPKLFGISLESLYTHMPEHDVYYGNVEFNLDKTVELINYIVGKGEVYKIKLMKLLWYTDALSFKRTGKSITGMPYLSLPMGAVPEEFETLVHLEGVKFTSELCSDGESLRYKFIPNDIDLNALSDEDKETADKIVELFGKMKTPELVKRMHEEEAYLKTKPNCKISFEHAKALTIC